MKEDARKTLELHELFNSHEWIEVARSFHVCKCGMCRGSQLAFATKTSKRWKRTTFTDWQKLSEVTKDEAWFKNKKAFIDRIKDYLVKYPYWAGVYGKQTGKVELLQVMMKDNQLRLEHCIRTRSFTLEDETALRSDIPKLLQFLRAKIESFQVKRLDLHPDTHRVILVNGDGSILNQLADIEGKNDEIFQKLLTQDSSYLVTYIRAYDSGNLTAKALLIKRAKESGSDNDMYQLLRLAEGNRGLHDPDIMETVQLTSYGCKRWIEMVSMNRRDPFDPRKKPFIDILVAKREADVLYDLVRQRYIPVDEPIWSVVCQTTRSGEYLPTPAPFNQKIWDLLVNAPNLNFKKPLMIAWKRKLRDQWTEDIRQLEEDTRSARRIDDMEKAKELSKRCSEVKAWAHSILVDYKRVLPKEDKD